MFKWLNNKTSVLEYATNMIIPVDMNNTHWLRVQAWIDEGNEPDPEFTLEERRSRRVGEANVMRVNAKAAGIMYDDNRYHSDRESRFSIASKIKAMEQGLFEKINWLTMDNSHQELTLQDLSRVFHLVEKRTQDCFDNYIRLRKIIATSDEPESVDIESGWPS
jgi:hypothetical protein